MTVNGNDARQRKTHFLLHCQFPFYFFSSFPAAEASLISFFDVSLMQNIFNATFFYSMRVGEYYQLFFMFFSTHNTPSEAKMSLVNVR